jgi:hypothetical protein
VTELVEVTLAHVIVGDITHGQFVGMDSLGSAGKHLFLNQSFSPSYCFVTEVLVGLPVP